MDRSSVLIKRFAWISILLCFLAAGFMAVVLLHPFGWFRPPQKKAPKLVVEPIAYKMQTQTYKGYTYRLHDENKAILISIDEVEKQMTIPSEIDDHVVVGLDNNFMSYNNDIESVKLPRGLKTIGPFSFLNCFNLKKVTFYEGLETIGDSAFQGCVRLEEVELPSSVTTIGAGAFGSCKSLASVIMNSKRPLTIGSGAFRDTAVSVVTFPSTTVEIGRLAFSCCRNLNVKNVPNGTKTFANTFQSGYVGKIPGFNASTQDEDDTTRKRTRTTSTTEQTTKKKTTKSTETPTTITSNLPSTDVTTNPSSDYSSTTQEPQTTNYHFWWDILGVLD